MNMSVAICPRTGRRTDGRGVSGEEREERRKQPAAARGGGGKQREESRNQEAGSAAQRSAHLPPERERLQNVVVLPLVVVRQARPLRPPPPRTRACERRSGKAPAGAHAKPGACPGGEMAAARLAPDADPQAKLGALRSLRAEPRPQVRDHPVHWVAVEPEVIVVVPDGVEAVEDLLLRQLPRRVALRERVPRALLRLDLARHLHPGLLPPQLVVRVDLGRGQGHERVVQQLQAPALVQEPPHRLRHAGSDSPSRARAASHPHASEACGGGGAR